MISIQDRRQTTPLIGRTCLIKDFQMSSVSTLKTQLKESGSVE